MTNIRSGSLLVHIFNMIPDPGSTKRSAAMQATNVAPRAKPCYLRSRGKRRRLLLGPNYATLVKDKVRMLKHAQAQSSNNCDTRSTHTIGRKLIGMKIILFWYELPTVFAVHSSLSETGPGI